MATSKKDVLGDFKVTKDNGLVITGSTASNFSEGEGLIIKLNGSGNVQWSYSIGLPGSTLGRILELENGDIAVLGNIDFDYQQNEYGDIMLAKRVHSFCALFSSEGKVKWAMECYQDKNFTPFFDLIELKDHTLLLGGTFITINKTTTSLLKVDKTNGSIKDEKSIDGFDCQKLNVLSDSTIRIYGHNYIAQLDNDLNIEWLKAVRYTNIDFPFSTQLVKLSTRSKNSIDTAYFCGNVANGSNYIPVLFKVINFNQVEWAHTYNSQNSLGATSVLTFTLNVSDIGRNNFGICGTFNTFNYSTNLNKNEGQTFFSQTNYNGETQCSTNINMGYQTTDIPNGGGFGANITTIAHHTIGTIPVTTFSKTAIQYIECYTVNCCRDTVIHVLKTICENESYLLPDGRTVNTEDIYTSAFHKTKGCDSIIVTELQIKKPFSITLPKDTCFINTIASISLKVSSSDTVVNYLWQDGSNQDHFNAKAAGFYHVKVFNDCYSTKDSVKIYENCALPIYIPNAFTPNHDNRNDLFRIMDLKGQHLINFSIYNRFGQNIFATSDYKNGWDGTYKKEPQNVGTYLYHIIYEDLTGKKQSLKGSFTLIR